MNPGVCKNTLCGTPLREMRSDAVWCSRACAMDQKRRDSANVGRTGTRRKRSGLQVSYWKVVELVAWLLIEQYKPEPVPYPIAQGWATAEVRLLLSDAQRARLDARHD